MFRWNPFCRRSCPSQNQRYRYVFSFFNKDNITCTGLPGAVFQIIDRHGYNQSAQSDLSGNVSFLLLSDHNYQLKEISPAANYQPYNRTHDIFINSKGLLFVDGIHQPSLTICNLLISSGTSFTSTKINASNNTPLAGVGFTLYQSGEIIATTTTDAFGNFTFANLFEGRYDLYETITPAGFHPVTTSFIIEVGSDYCVTIDGQPADSYQFINIPISMQELKFRKISAQTNYPLPGATFTLSQNGNMILSSTSDFSGMVNFGTLPIGIYTLAETIIPHGYRPDPDTHLVEISDTGVIMIDGDFLSMFTAAAYPYSDLQIRKVNFSNQAPLAGATFTLHQNGAPILTATTNTCGLANFCSLPSGSYVLQESAPPIGYCPNTTEYDVIVDPNGSIIVDGIVLDNNIFTVENSVENGFILIREIDITNGILLMEHLYSFPGGSVYGPYQPPTIPGYRFVGLDPASSPVTGTVTSGDTAYIAFLYA